MTSSKQILIGGIILVSSDTGCRAEPVLLVSLLIPGDKVSVDSAARTIWAPLLRRRRLASPESPERVEGGRHFLWLLSDDCV